MSMLIPSRQSAIDTIVAVSVLRPITRCLKIGRSFLSRAYRKLSEFGSIWCRSLTKFSMVTNSAGAGESVDRAAQILDLRPKEVKFVPLSPLSLATRKHQAVHDDVFEAKLKILTKEEEYRKYDAIPFDCGSVGVIEESPEQYFSAC